MHGSSHCRRRLNSRWWYQYYFATERGRAGYAKYRHDFNKLIWQIASPNWDFDDATFDRTAAAFNNPDHVSIVIHNYRWRQSVADGEPQYDDLEKRLAKAPVIAVPTITLDSDFDGAGPDGTLCQKILGQIFAPILEGHRSQCASRSPARVCPSSR